MLPMTDTARADLHSYLARVREAARSQKADPEDVAAGVREHVDAALASREAAGAVTAAELAEVLERLGKPSGWAAAEASADGDGETVRVGKVTDWRQLAVLAAGRVGRALRFGIATVVVFWPIGLVWSAAQRGGVFYEWIPGGTPWSGFRPPVYWGRIAALAAAALGSWWLMLAAALLSPPGRGVRSRLRRVGGVDPARAAATVGGSVLVVSLLGFFL